jgi:hypothetical protein
LFIPEQTVPNVKLVFAGFGVLAYSAYKEKREWEVIVSIVLALLFQPFLKLSLGREIWNVIDVVVSIYLVITTFAFPRKVL